MAKIANNLYNNSEASKYMRDNVNDVKEYILLNYKSFLSLSEIANKFYINPQYLSYIFKKVEGIRLFEYINKIRIEKSKILLVKTELKIFEISDKVGFSTYGNFSKMFKHFTGISPQKYRKQTKNNTI